MLTIINLPAKLLCHICDLQLVLLNSCSSKPFSGTLLCFKSKLYEICDGFYFTIQQCFISLWFLVQEDFSCEESDTSSEDEIGFVEETPLPTQDGTHRRRKTKIQRRRMRHMLRTEFLEHFMRGSDTECDLDIGKTGLRFCLLFVIHLFSPLEFCIIGDVGLTGRKISWLCNMYDNIFRFVLTVQESISQRT